MLNVFDMFTSQDRFFEGGGNGGKRRNGERFLHPQKCESVQDLNGDWSLTIDYIMSDKDDAWKFLRPYNIIMNSQGQLFPIYSVTKKINSNGLPVLSAKARHIFYYLNDKIVRNVNIDYYACYWAINSIYQNIEWGYGNDLVDYSFNYYSNLPNDFLKSAKYDGESAAYCLLGGAESIVNLYAGELYRDNFYFSINDRMEYCRENAFNLIHGWNLIEVSETTDVSEKITKLEAEDNMGHSASIARVPDRTFPHQVLKYIKISYSSEKESRNFNSNDPEIYERNKAFDTDGYYIENMNANVSYDVNFQDLRNTNLAKDWQDLERLNVGDYGTVYSQMLDISTEQRVISKTIDEITGRVTKMKLGNFKPSALHISRYEKMLNTDDSNSRRLDNVEDRLKELESREEDSDE